MRVNAMLRGVPSAANVDDDDDDGVATAAAAADDDDDDDDDSVASEVAVVLVGGVVVVVVVVGGGGVVGAHVSLHLYPCPRNGSLLVLRRLRSATDGLALELEVEAELELTLAPTEGVAGSSSADHAMPLSRSCRAMTRGIR